MLKTLGSTIVGVGLLVSACGGGAVEQRTTGGDVVAAPDAGTAASGSLTEPECAKLFDHLFALMEKGMPPEEWAAGKDELEANKGQLVQECTGGEVTRPLYECMLAAKDLPSVDACAAKK